MQYRRKNADVLVRVFLYEYLCARASCLPVRTRIRMHGSHAQPRAHAISCACVSAAAPASAWRP
eukprot:2820750-Pleurochrysis_carterae.AAC.2